MKMLAKRKRRLSIQLDMTPMVDIAFLLLIFYMTTTQFKPPEKNLVDLPESHSQISMPDADIISITVTRDDSVFVEYILKDSVYENGRVVLKPERINVATSPDFVGKYIQHARTKNPQSFLVLKADRQANYGTIEAIMNALRDEKMYRFQIITEVESDV